MDIRATYDSARRLTEWLDSDITAFTIRHAIAFAIVWWLSRGFFRRAAEIQTPVITPVPARHCVDRAGTDQMFQSCMSGLARSANCDFADCGARAA